MGAPLAGVRVVRLGAAPAVVYGCRLLADLGAEIVAANSDDADTLSHAGIVLCGSIASATATREEAGRLLSTHPHLVVVAVTPYGLDGSAAGWAADDLILQAVGGISLGIGLPGRPPLKLPGDQSSYQAGVVAAIAALGALHAGKGALVDLSAADVWAGLYAGVDVALAHFGRQKKGRAGHRVSGQPYPRTLYRCRDGYFAIQCGESRHWQAFLRMTGREDLLQHPLFANRFKANDEHGDACDAEIGPWFLSRTKNEILDECMKFAIPGAPVYDMSEIAGHPHLVERGYFRQRSTARGLKWEPGNLYASASEGDAVAAPSTRRSSKGAGPLSGIRVVDFGWVWAGAVPGHVLADLGAEVIKVESASPLDYMRQGRPIVGKVKDPEQNPMFQNVNRGKLSLRIRLDHPDAAGVLKDLIATSDVVIENFSPGVMRKFGLAYDALAAVRPGLVMCSMSAVGQQGPLRGIRTYATMIASLAGLDSQVGYAGGRVLGSQSSYADPNASLHATVGVLAALWRRARTGEGANLDLSQWEAAVSVMGEALEAYSAAGVVPGPAGIRHAVNAPYGHYPASGTDRWIAISISDDAQWRVLAVALGDPSWMSDDEYRSADARRKYSDQLDRRLSEETSRHDAPALAERLAASGVPAAPLLDAAAMAVYPPFVSRHLYETVDHPVLGPLPVYRLPWHVDGQPLAITRRAPMLGEHNGYVMDDILRYGREQRAALEASGVFA